MLNPQRGVRIWNFITLLLLLEFCIITTKFSVLGTRTAIIPMTLTLAHCHSSPLENRHVPFYILSHKVLHGSWLEFNKVQKNRIIGPNRSCYIAVFRWLAQSNSTVLNKIKNAVINSVEQWFKQSIHLFNWCAWAGIPIEQIILSYFYWFPQRALILENISCHLF